MDIEQLAAEAREGVVLAIAFLGRDHGTDRAERTVPQVIDELRKADEALRAIAAALKSAPAPEASEVTEAMTKRELCYAYISKLRLSDKQGVERKMGTAPVGAHGLERDKAFLRTVFETGREGELERGIAARLAREGDGR